METQKRSELVYLPDWSRDNPYQKLLYGEIGRAGIPCRGLVGKDFTFGWLFGNRSSCRFIHLHWLFGVYDPTREGLSSKLAVLFLLKLIFARLLGYRIVWTVHNFVSHEPTNIKLELLVRKAVARLAHTVIAHCNHAKKLIVDNWKVSPEKVAVIPHGSYVGYYPNTVSREEARQNLGIGEEEFVYLFFGMLRGYKGIKPLVQSFKEIRELDNKVRLVIAGKPFTDEIRNEIEEMAAGDRISLFLEYIPDAEVQMYFNACDIVVLPYQNVLTSGSAILAISFRRLVIVPAIGCMTELIGESLGVAYEDSGLASAMTALKKEKSVNEKAFDDAIVSMSWERISSEQYVPLLKKIE